ncbi:signal peptidase II [candidate division KSB1 bacterium]
MRIFYVTAVVFILDQVTKWIAKTTLNLRESVPVIGEAFKFTHIQNPGMAFGLAIPNKLIFNGLSILAAIAILFYLIKFRDEKFLPRFSLAIIFGGAIGNLLDRLAYGKVIDFFDVNIPDIDIPSFNIFFFDTPAIYLDRWPIFNVADMAVSIGMILLIYTIISSDNPWRIEESEEPVSDEVQEIEEQPV